MPLPYKTIITIFNSQSIDNILKTDLKKSLIDEEQDKYKKFDKISRKDFAAGRVALRESLASFKKIQNLMSLPLDIKVNYEESGKPFLERNKKLEISISHSNGWGAALVSNFKFVAIDIEKIKSRDTSLIDYVLSKKERGLIKVEITDEILSVCWTMKEAIMKALGIGLILHHIIALESFLLYDSGYIANFMYQGKQTKTDIQFWTVKSILVDKYAISIAYPYKLHESIIFDWNIKIGLQPTKKMSDS